MELAAAAAATEAQQIENNIERHFLDGLYSEEEVEELPSSPLETEPVRVYRGGGSTERMEDILRRHPATAPYSTREEVLAVTLRILFPREFTDRLYTNLREGLRALGHDLLPSLSELQALMRRMPTPDLYSYRGGQVVTRSPEQAVRTIALGPTFNPDTERRPSISLLDKRVRRVSSSSGDVFAE